ncbi:hypothetical protein B0J18DRAFT_431645 [Chaetomium sp. MPI-SDFR-AT-0129]|nr:hypothetical protein B0J18DRAFT_431645 [Chaetomium sp. MPI-SDFR-AT-0129]
MLGLRSMAAQLRACHCRACLRATKYTTTTKRVTTTTTTTNYTEGSRRPRKLLRGDTFTTYHTAASTGAVAFEEPRQQDWWPRSEPDERSAEARRSLAALLHDSASRDLASVVASPYPDVPYTRPREKLDFFWDLCKLETSSLKDVPRKLKDRLNTARRLRSALGLPWNPDIPAAKDTTLARCEELLFADTGVNLDAREPRTEKHLERTMEMMIELTDRLMVQSWHVTEAKAPGTHFPLTCAESPYNFHKMLRNDGYPAYSYPMEDLETTFLQRAELNKTLLQLFERWNPRLRDRYVGKVCYNLLVCSVPPGIENYSFLILGFSFLGEHELSQEVVDSLLYKSQMKPTEATYLCLLHHYRLKRDIAGFQSIARRMFGFDPRGIGLIRRGPYFVANYPQLHSWANPEEAAFMDGLYIRRAPFTQDVAEAMMEGLVDFGMIREGAKLFAVCLREQWTFSRELIWRLFHSCITLMDVPATKLIIRGLLDNIDQASLLLLGPVPVSSKPVRQMRNLLNIWQATTLPRSSDAFDDDFDDADFKTESDKTRLDHLATAVWIRETWHHTSMMNVRLRHAARVVLNKDKPLLDRLDTAMSVVVELEERPKRETEKSERFGRLARLDWLTAQTTTADFRIRNFEKMLANAVARNTPRQLQSWVIFSETVPLKVRLARSLKYCTLGSIEHHIATCFALSKEIDLQLKRNLIQALPLSYAAELEKKQTTTGDVRLDKILDQVVRYLSDVKIRQNSQRARKEAEAEPDPFARLLAAIPEPMSFWKKNPAPAGAEGNGPTPENTGW